MICRREDVSFSNICLNMLEEIQAEKNIQKAAQAETAQAMATQLFKMHVSSANSPVTPVTHQKKQPQLSDQLNPTSDSQLLPTNQPSSVISQPQAEKRPSQPSNNINYESAEVYGYMPMDPQTISEVHGHRPMDTQSINLSQTPNQVRQSSKTMPNNVNLQSAAETSLKSQYMNAVNLQPSNQIAGARVFRPINHQPINQFPHQPMNQFSFQHVQAYPINQPPSSAVPEPLHAGYGCMSDTSDQSFSSMLSSSLNIAENSSANTCARSSTPLKPISSDNLQVDDTCSYSPIGPFSSDSFNCHPTSSECSDCAAKDIEIAQLKQKITELTSSSSRSQSTERVKQYKPKTRPDIELCDYIEIDDPNNIPDGYHLISRGTQVAVRSTWLHDILATVSRNMDRRKKRAACAARKNPDRKKRTIDLDTETLKRLMDGFYEPSELAKAGGTGAFEGDVIYGALKAYAVNELKMDVASFKRAWNTKMATCRETVAKLSSKEIDV